MGVKDLWTILSPISERKSLWELQDKTIAIDLSGWVCDSQNVAEYNTQPRMYLRNLFFRTTCLLLIGAKPVFALEGVAPSLKHNTIARRNDRWNHQRNGADSSEFHNTRKGNRSRLMSLLKQCNELLNMMGLSSIQSMGEAEALCALLDQNKMVDGCISQDSDCLLYGAQTVYRNFTISPTNGNAGFSIDMYKMSTIHEKLSLSRDKLIAMSLLCGCDYNEKGVAGVGKETVLKFLNGVAEGEVLDRLRKWRNNRHLDMLEEAKATAAKGSACERCGHRGRQQKHEKSGCVECGVSTGCLQDPLRIGLTDPVILAELTIRRKALLDENFPCEATIQEFLQEENIIPPGKLDKTWKRPDLLTFIKYSTKKLSWTEMYALGKFLPLVTRWQLQQIISNKESASTSDFLLSPQSIIKKRVLKGILSYEVQWTDEHGSLRNMDLDEGVTLESLLVTIEPQTLLQEAYPRLVSSFLEKIAEKNKKGKAKKKRGKAKCCVGEGKENSGCGVQTKLDGFVVRQQPTNNIEDLFSKITLHSKENSSQSNTEKTMQLKLPTSFGTLKLRNGNIASSLSDGLAAWKSETSVTHTDLSDECDECDDDCSLDLSSIIEDIVGKENYQSECATTV